MGGSGIAGDILIAAAGPFLPVPVVVCKSYTLPAFVGDASLVIAVSCSGNTEETLEAASEAALQGAKMVAVTGGGELAKLAAGWGAPMVTVPSNIPQPRAALGAMAVPPMIVLEEIGLFPGAGQWVDLAVSQLQRRRDRLTGPKSDAAEIARRSRPDDPAGPRWWCPRWHGRTSLEDPDQRERQRRRRSTRNTPSSATTRSRGGASTETSPRQVMTLVNLRHDHEHPQVSMRFELVAELMREVMADIIEVQAEGEGELAQLLDLIMVGDFVSLEMAAREGIDPGPVPALVSIKEALSGG